MHGNIVAPECLEVGLCRLDAPLQSIEHVLDTLEGLLGGGLALADSRAAGAHLLAAEGHARKAIVLHTVFLHHFDITTRDRSFKLGGTSTLLLSDLFDDSCRQSHQHMQQQCG